MSAEYIHNRRSSFNRQPQACALAPCTPAAHKIGATPHPNACFASTELASVGARLCTTRDKSMNRRPHRACLGGSMTLHFRSGSIIASTEASSVGRESGNRSESVVVQNHCFHRDKLGGEQPALSSSSTNIRAGGAADSAGFVPCRARRAELDQSELDQ